MGISDIINDKSDLSIGIEKRLDTILEILYKKRFIDNSTTPLNAQELCNQLAIFDKQLEHGELEELFDILSEDKYVLLNKGYQNKIENATNSTITIRGALFHKSSGYVNELVRKNIQNLYDTKLKMMQKEIDNQLIAQNNRMEKQSERMEILQGSLRNLTRWLVFGAVGILIWDIIKYLVENYCWCF